MTLTLSKKANEARPIVQFSQATLLVCYTGINHFWIKYNLHILCFLLFFQVAAKQNMSSEQLKQKKSLAATEREENQRFFFILAFFSPIYFCCYP